MNMGNLLPRRWRTRIEATRHAEAISDVLETPPIEPRQDGVVLFSMIGTAVLLPYLVAVKSLWHHLGRGRVAILDDGTLTAQDRAILAHHCGDPQIMRIADVKLNEFPAGGTWERLLTILDNRAGEYWIQLDSDTVTIGAVPEISEAIARNRSFLFLGGKDAEVGPFRCENFASASTLRENRKATCRHASNRGSIPSMQAAAGNTRVAARDLPALPPLAAVGRSLPLF